VTDVRGRSGAERELAGSKSVNLRKLELKKSGRHINKYMGMGRAYK
jgi:hypothetical protein